MATAKKPKTKAAEKKQVKTWQKELEARQKSVAAERDKLDAVISEMEELRECCDRAWDALQDARDALSELV